MLIENTVRLKERTEKAGVGGSTPSLATMFSVTYNFFLNFYITVRGRRSWADSSNRLEDFL